MNEGLNNIVQALLEVYEQLARMSTMERMRIGDEFATAVRRINVLTRFELNNRPFRQGCTVETGALTLQIHGSSDSDDDDLPF